MQAAFAGTFFAWVAHIMAAVVLPPKLIDSVVVRALATWMICAAAMMFIGSLTTMFLFVGLAMLILAPTERTPRVAFFIMVVPCLPTYMSESLPFPGIENLIALTHAKVAAIAVLLPALLLKPAPGPRQPLLALGGVSLILYMVFAAVMTGQSTSPTDGLRSFVDNICVLALPYAAIVRSIRSQEDFDACASAVVVAAVVLACVTLVSTAQNWDFYLLRQFAWYAPDYRFGFMRIHATGTPHTIGYFCAFGLFCLLYLRHRGVCSAGRLLFVSAVLLSSLFITGSRGAAGGLVFGLGTYITLMTPSVALRRTLMLVMAVGALGVASWLMWGSADELDATGNVNYRRDLMTTSLAYIGQHFWLGDFHFIRAESFAHLRQGQGIIDITNLYLQIALMFGMIGLTLFFFFFIAPLVTMLRRFATSAGSQRDIAIVAAAHVGWLFLVATTSQTGHTLELGIIAAALARTRCQVTPVSKGSRAARARAAYPGLRPIKLRRA